jgi:hypothetical protein
MRQAEIEIHTWLGAHLSDSGGALAAVLHCRVKGSELLLKDFEEPLVVLASFCQRILDSDYLLKNSFARRASNWDERWANGPTSSATVHRGTPTTPTQSRPSRRRCADF